VAKVESFCFRVNATVRSSTFSTLSRKVARQTDGLNRQFGLLAIS
jgi:hypothetical protein